MINISFLHTILLFIVFLNVPDIIYSQTWIRQQTPVSLRLYRCTFPDSLHGWSAGEDGVIIRTTDGGSSWVMQNSPVDFFIYDIYFLNNKLGWAIANDNIVNGSAVLSTTDGGNNWSSYRFPDSSILYAIHFKDSLNGITGGYNGKIFRTSDGGLNWFRAAVDSSFSSYFPVLRISYKNSLYCASGGLYDLLGVIWLSTNNGSNWKSNGLAAEPIFCFEILSNSKVIAMGGDFEFGAIIAKTYNTGINWFSEYLNIFGIPTGLSFRTDSEAWAVLSISAKFLYTLDTGISWQTYDVPDNTSLYDIKFTDPYHGYAVGDFGTVYKYNAETIGIINNNEKLPINDELFQNYPNPFNPLTTIEYYLKKPSIVKLTVFDITGRVVKEFNGGFNLPGFHKFKFDASNLSSGVYYYKLFTNDFTDVKKMVIIK